MNSAATNRLNPRRLPVEWLDAPAIGPWPICRGKVRSAPGLCRGALPRAVQRAGAGFPGRRLRAFTLLELMMVVAIIGFIAVLTLPHVKGYNQANSMTSATRQLLDDLALARQRAMVNRSSVYMVFLPPMFWTNYSFNNPPAGYEIPGGNQITNLLTHQYSAYALVSLATVGDQPGQHYARYLTDWRFLPDGVIFSPLEFGYTTTNLYIYTTNTLSGTVTANLIQPWSTNNLNNLPFPSLYPPNTTNLSLPCIAFSPQGSLETPYANQYIVLARGSVFYPVGTNGAPLFAPPNLTETPPGNEINNPNLIQIDWLTARATLVQNQLQ